MDKFKEERIPIDAHTRIKAQEQLGVGVMVHKSLRPCIQNVVAVSSRLIIWHLKTTNNLYFYSAYSPTAEHDDATKDIFYDSLEQKWRSIPNDSFKVLLGDFNAKIARVDDDEVINGTVGPFYLKASDHFINNMSNDTWDNRRRFLEFCQRNELWVANTFFQ